MKKKRLEIRLSKELHGFLKNYADNRECSMNQAIIQLLIAEKNRNEEFYRDYRYSAGHEQHTPKKRMKPDG